MLSFVVLSIIMLSVVMLNVVLLNVVASDQQWDRIHKTSLSS